jgi:hypothetical protein
LLLRCLLLCHAGDFTVELQLLSSCVLLHKVTQQLVVSCSPEVQNIDCEANTELSQPLLAGCTLPQDALR